MTFAKFRLAFSLLILLGPTPAPAQQPSLPPLSFLGFEAGAHLESVNRRVVALGGHGLACHRARRDRTVQECRGSVTDPVSRRAVNLWLSAMDSAAGVLTISSPLTGAELDAWKRSLEASFGRVNAAVLGPQRSLQWVRAGRMLRLTWRTDSARKVASVSLVDGHVLDAWGRRRAGVAAARDGRPASSSP